jgi:uncharacterized membrane protein (DUF485 family)
LKSDYRPMVQCYTGIGGAVTCLPLVQSRAGLSGDWQSYHARTVRSFLTVASIVSLAFGLGFVLITGQLTSFYNVTLNPGGVLVGQLFGAVLIGFGALSVTLDVTPL